MASLTIGGIGKILLLIIFLAIAIWAFFGPGELYDRVRDLVEGVKEVAPTMGSDEYLAGDIALPETHNEAVTGLYDTMNQMANSPKKNCFANYGGLPGGLGQRGEGTEIELFEESGNVFYIVKNGNQIVPGYPTQIPGAKLCVIASDDGSVAENFYNQILKQESGSGSYVSNIAELKIYYTDGTDGCVVSNGIHIDTGILPAEGDCSGDNLQDGGWLFKGPNNEICFFPTESDTLPSITDDCESEDYGLKSDCLEDAGSGDNTAIPNLIAEGKLKLCGNQEGWTKYWWVNILEEARDLGTDEYVWGSIDKTCLEGLSCFESKDKQCVNNPPEKYEMDGCKIFATSSNSGDCAAGGAKEGAQIRPRATSNSDVFDFISSNDIVSSSVKGTTEGVNLLLDNFAWKTNTDYGLLCKESRWYECNELSKDKSLIIGTKNYVCTKSGASYLWEGSSDSDSDGVPDLLDNCPNIVNADQLDKDSDTFGNVCDDCVDDFGTLQGCPETLVLDSDFDGVNDNVDNCPLTSNGDQLDADGDLVGDACDDCVNEFGTSQGTLQGCP